MRLSAVSAALVLAIAGSALAQEYVEFTSKDDRFGVTFPTQPKVEQIMFKSQFGSMLPARLYTSDSGNSDSSPKRLTSPTNEVRIRSSIAQNGC